MIKRLDGRWCVEHLFADASIDAYHTYFPDPWWKKRHAKRRLFTPAFAAALLRTLRHDGCLYVITDVETRFREIAETLAEAGFVATPWEREPASPAQSSYERKYRAQGRRLFSARFVKR
jgi:tRNA (guanine-N7-)-methyltransferase